MKALRILSRTLVIITGLLVYGFVSYLMIDYGVLDDPIHAAAALGGIATIIGYSVNQSTKPDPEDVDARR